MKFLVCVCVFSEVSTPLFFLRTKLNKTEKEFFNKIFVIKFFFVCVMKD